MQIITVKGKKWAVGLEWEFLPQDSSNIKQEAKAVAETNDANFGVLIDYDGKHAIGLAKKQPPKNPSASLYLALANQEFRDNNPNEMMSDWIVIEEVGDDKFWMGVIKEGVPAPQYDAILDITTIKDKITELMSSETFKLYSTSADINALFDGIREVYQKNLNDLTESVVTKIKFDKLRGIPNVVIYAGIAGIVLMGVAWGALSFVEGRDIKEKAATIRKKQEEEHQRKVEAYQNAMKEYNNLKKTNYENAVKQVSLSLTGSSNAILNSLYNMVGNTPVPTSGWDLLSIKCERHNEVKPEITCDYLFKRSSLATNRMLLQDYPNANITGDDAVVKKVVPISNNELMVQNQTIEDLKGAKSWGFDMLSQLQLMKIAEVDHKVEPSQQLFYEEPSKPVSVEEADNGKQPLPAQQIALGLSKGAVIVGGKNFDLMRELAQNINFSGVGFKSAVFEIKGLGEIQWELKFDYFIKDQEGTIGAANSSKMSTNVLEAAVPNGQQPQDTNNQPPRQ